MLTRAPSRRATGFVVGSGIVTADGMRDADYSPKIRKPAKTTFQPKGTLEAWKDAPRMYRVLKQYPAQLAMCLSLATPLMQYGLGEARSATYSLWSNTSGKVKRQSTHGRFCLGLPARAVHQP